MSGYWFVCVFCGADAVGVARLGGLAHGVPIRLERGGCQQCLQALLDLELPTVLPDDRTLLSYVDVAMPMFNDKLGVPSPWD